MNVAQAPSVSGSHGLAVSRGAAGPASTEDLAAPFRGRRPCNAAGGYPGCGAPSQPDPGLALALLEHPWTGQALDLLRREADQMRQRLVGDTVTYVVNRNLNPSNICVPALLFCAFRRDAHQSGAYWLTINELQERARQAQLAGATELCVQVALIPDHRGWKPAGLCRERLLLALRESAPGVHLHAFSPQELLFSRAGSVAARGGLASPAPELAWARFPAQPPRVLRTPEAAPLSRKAHRTLLGCGDAQVHRAGLRSTSTLLGWAHRATS